MRGAILKDADLREAQLRGTDLRGANLEAADCRSLYSMCCATRKCYCSRSFPNHTAQCISCIQALRL